MWCAIRAVSFAKGLLQSGAVGGMAGRSAGNALLNAPGVGQAYPDPGDDVTRVGHNAAGARNLLLCLMNAVADRFNQQLAIDERFRKRRNGPSRVHKIAPRRAS